jgi:hypothetical protein
VKAYGEGFYQGAPGGRNTDSTNRESTWQIVVGGNEGDFQANTSDLKEQEYISQTNNIM